MNSRKVLLSALLPIALTAQEARDMVPLKNWSTPLYWHASDAERKAVANPVPQLQFSGNQVSTDALTFVAVTPCRLVDTRGAAVGFNGIDPFAGPYIPSGGILTIPVQSATEASTNTTPAPCGTIPSIAQAYSFNLTVVPASAGGVNYVTIWPAGGTQPVVSTTNDTQGEIVANAAIVPAGSYVTSGGVSVYNAGPAATNVIIDMNGFYAAPSDLNGNTAIGMGSLASNTTGDANTASGVYALYSNTTGSQNTATGYDALLNNTTGSGNTAYGVNALLSNTTGRSNTATGAGALNNNTIGVFNTASGFGALQSNTSGSDNTASGNSALLNNTAGYDNTASGYLALEGNTTGAGNTAVGVLALNSNTNAGGNSAIGDSALTKNITGSSNTASGYGALAFNITGSNNIAIGNAAAYNAPVGNNNSIYIGSQGTGSDASGAIQIGTQGLQTGGTYIAGISGASSPSGVEVFVNSSGQLGTILSSGRFKQQITDMGDRSSKLLELRPVNFFYKPEYDDGSHQLQYGLVAEEVAKVYPEMVAYGNDGQLLTVKYQLLAPMLLNELQKQHAEADQRAQQQDQTIRGLEARLAALEAY